MTNSWVSLAWVLPLLRPFLSRRVIPFAPQWKLLRIGCVLHAARRHPFPSSHGALRPSLQSENEVQLRGREAGSEAVAHITCKSESATAVERTDHLNVGEPDKYLPENQCSPANIPVFCRRRRRGGQHGSPFFGPSSSSSAAARSSLFIVRSSFHHRRCRLPPLSLARFFAGVTLRPMVSQTCEEGRGLV